MSGLTLVIMVIITIIILLVFANMGFGAVKETIEAVKSKDKGRIWVTIAVTCGVLWLVYVAFSTFGPELMKHFGF